MELILKLSELLKEFDELLKKGLWIENLERFFQENQGIFQLEQSLRSSADVFLESMIKKIIKMIFLLSSEETIQIFKKLFERISNYPFYYYPIFFKIFTENLWYFDKINASLIRPWIIGINEKDYPLLYIWCCMFKNLIINLTNKELISSFIREAKELNNEYIAKHLLIWTFANTKKIPWTQKRDLFWQWEENPLFLLKEENPLLWTLWNPPFCCESSRELKKYKEKFQLSLSFYLSLCDLYILLKEIKKEITNEDRKILKEMVFKNFIDYLNSLNSKIYEDFWSNSESMQNLIEIGLLLSKAEFWNKIIKGLISYDTQRNGKKNEELYKIYFLIDTLTNNEKIEKIEEIKTGETPDFTLITQSKKIIGIEIVRYDTPEQMERLAEQEICPAPKYININISKIFRKRLKERIKGKINKLQDKKSQYDELWLYLVPYSEGALIEGILAREIQEFKKENEEIFKFEEFSNFFNKIYLVIGTKIHDLVKEEEYPNIGDFKARILINTKIQNSI